VITGQETGRWNLRPLTMIRKTPCVAFAGRPDPSGVNFDLNHASIE
jgi:hypothetical protein